MTRTKAIKIGWLSIGAAICVQLFNNFACYKAEFIEAFTSLWFTSIPLIPAIAFLSSKNPLRAVGASITVILFYMLAFYIDCVRPYEGGGASMIYVGVILYGTPLAVLFGFVSGWFFNTKGITVEKR